MLKMSWRRLEDVFKTSWRRLEEVLKTCWRCLEDVLKTYDQDEYVGLDEGVLKTSSEDVWVRRINSSWSRRLEDVLKTSSEDEYQRRLQDVFIKTNVCWVVTSFVTVVDVGCRFSTRICLSCDVKFKYSDMVYGSICGCCTWIQVSALF